MKPRILEYVTLRDSRLDDLDAKVCKYIRDGWEPYGHQYYTGVQYTQPMVYREWKAEE